MTDHYKRKKAVALSYDEQNDQAPRVVATGSGLIAQQIIEKAQKAELPIQQDHNLIELLATLNINEKIPEELYHAVAEVFAFIYQVDKHTDIKRKK
ncbi:Flagellar biosynthetic protein FlhB [Paraliobacillus sp. PM-2]|uniref:EscU/YscU/HrcU family type III secretion system export apparatus switch protein n=1 Tax=Paraliobacillus sp. PM-2 TaxID=1462524 RepID=UPI00061BD66F|nr:EscU/YscU/HrcU family type III secretion system export apparatus switch protein [Paraliobacillus sp. PM-2]CQR47712.1 Flagellar biosynthetic protein FlhB [Paraliobacillus sp. PM-2]